MHKWNATLETPGARMRGVDAAAIRCAVLGIAVFGLCGAMLLLLYLPVR